MRLNKKKWALFLAPLVIVFIVFLIFRFKDKARYARPKHGPIVEAIYGLGKVKSHRKYEIKIGVSTKIIRSYVNEGDFVNRGDPLIKFRDFELVKAPFPATVTKFDFQEPEIVSPTDTIMTLEDLKNRYIEVSLEQEGALRVKRGQSAKVLFESLRNLVYEGKVDKIFPKDEEFLIQIEIPNLGENILPGMTADVTVGVAEHDNALLIPVSSISNGQAILKRDGKKMKVPVRIGIIDGQWAQVTEGDIKMDDEMLLGN